MAAKLGSLPVVSGLFLAATFGGFFFVGATPAHAVYCDAIGVPKGCVARPATAAPVTRAGETPGVTARGLGVRAGTPMNRGGPVNRVGRR